MAQQDDQLHFILVPLMAQGHMIPIVDMARMFSRRDIVVTIVTTPLNNLRFKSIIDGASDLPIRTLQFYFPSVEVGLPEGCENLDSIPSRGLASNFFVATSMLQKPLEQSLAEMKPKPSCIISDFYLPWTCQTAQKFDIPRLVFHGTSCFSLLCTHNLHHCKVLESVNVDLEQLVLPGLPDSIEIAMSCLPEEFNKKSIHDTKGLHDQIEEAESTSYGVVLNSFYDLESLYIERYQIAKQCKAWFVGPVSLYNTEVTDKMERGGKASINVEHCLKWLDLRKPQSVVYVCLGSLCRLKSEQFIEIGLGLEATNCSFIWVIKCGERYKELEKWLFEEAFEERTKDRGLVIRGWAPQVLILSHQAIGGFITHCGWNSTLEGMCAGVPLITWPMFSEQFLNEKLVVNVLKIGIPVGVSGPVRWGEEDRVGVLVRKEEINKAVRKLMHEDDEGQERRKRTKDFAKMAKEAMEEGGSSYLSMTLMIQDIKNQANKKAFIPQKQNNVRDMQH
ncbi:hypothetical protein IFM89_033349 [Coptis chinensis]|uniref:Glycosyltransferase n=1 Tax=Coptis chinensis TaxID=261450 RepID=A0A835LPN0_9MAGN|nr:hypothetical protein IFM89_033349 [Coptis chinensis]